MNDEARSIRDGMSVLAGVDVYKGTEADHTAAAGRHRLSARTRPLDVRSPRPLASRWPRRLSTRSSSESRTRGYRVFATYVDQFADGKVGVLRRPTWTSYQTRTGTQGPQQLWRLQRLSDERCQRLQVWIKQLKRLSTNATFKGEAQRQHHLSVDGFYSTFKEKVDKRGWEMPPFNWGWPPTVHRHDLGISPSR
jgi:hypothetical protein